jgi:hypothetical protein
LDHASVDIRDVWLGRAFRRHLRVSEERFLE